MGVRGAMLTMRSLKPRQPHFSQHQGKANRLTSLSATERLLERSKRVESQLPQWLVNRVRMSYKASLKYSQMPVNEE